jgi:Ca-activated chloride channel homolog
MTFAYSSFLWLLLAVPPAMLLFFWWSAKARQKLMTQFIQARLLPGLVAGVSASREKIRAASLVAAVVCLLLALARPQWGYDLEEVKQRGLDIVVAIDTSKSMLAEDIAPNRLARAKLAALDLMQQAKSDRLGLVAFAGSAFLRSPLTIDDVAFRQSVESLDVNTLPVGGSALAEAIETALKAFKEGDSYKVLVLFSDGEDHDSDAVEAARKAAEEGLRIFTIGIGSAEGELLRIKAADGQSDYVRDENGNVVKSHLNEGLLQKIAGTANGFYLPLRGANTMDTLYQKGLAPLPKSEAQEKWVKRARERYHWPLAAAIALLLAEMFFSERKLEPKRANAAKSAGLVATATVLLLLLLLPRAAVASSSSALREYKSGRYDEALKKYERALEKKTDDPRLHFNAGAAAYRAGQFDQAARHFEEALGSPDVNLQEQAYYNLGNTLYHLGEQAADPAKKTESWEQSLEKYATSLKLNTQDADAKFNQEFVKKRLEELRQQQQEQQSKQDQSKKDENQQQQNQQGDQQKSDQQQEQKEGSQQQQPHDQKQADQNQQKKQSGQPDKKEEKPQQDQEQQQARPSGGEKKDDQESDEQSEVSYAPGQMTPQQARQLLDAQKNDERLLPVTQTEKTASRTRSVKDW